MVNKIMTLEQAVADVRDGMTIMVGGFLATGSPEILMDALVEKGVKHLTVIANDGGLDAGQPAGISGSIRRSMSRSQKAHFVIRWCRRERSQKRFEPRLTDSAAC